MSRISCRIERASSSLITMYNAHAFLVNVTKHSILALLLLLFTLLPVQADPTVINVATVERPPFVMKRGTGHIGYSIELWDAIAKELKVNYDLRVYETFPDMLNSVKNKENDLAVANITITSERERHFDFSHPIFLSGLQIMLSKNRPSGFMGTLNAILKSGILKVLGGALLILLLVAHLIWISNESRAHITANWGPMWKLVRDDPII